MGFDFDVMAASREPWTAYIPPFRDQAVCSSRNNLIELSKSEWPIERICDLGNTVGKVFVGEFG